MATRNDLLIEQLGVNCFPPVLIEVVQLPRSTEVLLWEKRVVDSVKAVIFTGQNWCVFYLLARGFDMAMAVRSLGDSALQFCCLLA